MTGTWFQMQAQAGTQAHDNYDEGKLVSGHLGEGLLQLLGDGLELLLLGDELIFEPVHLLLQLQHGLLSELSAGLSLLQLGGEGLDLLLVGLLTLVRLLFTHLQQLNATVSS